MIWENIFILIMEIFKGKSLLRILMNLELRNYTLGGKVLDLGGGSKPSYLRFFKKEKGLEFMGIDIVAKEKGLALDLEKERVPYSDDSIDQVLLFNIMEHIYNYKFLLAETKRVLKANGRILGFVPFSVCVHPDPHDYFRYTKECLEKIFVETGFQNIHIKGLGLGPLAINYNNLSNYLPRIIKLIVLPFYCGLDLILIKLKPSLRQKFPLGYFFELS